jgi:hypothetical protein
MSSCFPTGQEVRNYVVFSVVICSSDDQGTCSVDRTDEIRNIICRLRSNACVCS